MKTLFLKLIHRVGDVLDDGVLDLFIAVTLFVILIPFLIVILRFLWAVFNLDQSSTSTN